MPAGSSDRRGVHHRLGTTCPKACRGTASPRTLPLRLSMRFEIIRDSWAAVLRRRAAR
jgi:hypothetical protein